MAYKGAIDYLDLPFDGVEWEKDDIRSRWLNSADKSWTYSRDCSVCPLELTVKAWVFDLKAAQALDKDSIILDDPGKTEELGVPLKCVILGRLKTQMQDLRDARRHYVLLVIPKVPQGGGAFRIYNRVGVGYVSGELIGLNEQVAQGELR